MRATFIRASAIALIMAIGSVAPASAGDGGIYSGGNGNGWPTLDPHGPLGGQHSGDTKADGGMTGGDGMGEPGASGGNEGVAGGDNGR